MKQRIVLVAIIGGAIAALAATYSGNKRFRDWCRHYFFRARSTASRATDFRTQPLNDVEAAKACRANLRRIENAKRKVAQQKSMAVGRLTWEDLRPEIGAVPRCPSGGEYILGDVGAMPKCTIGSNGTVRTEDDHIVLNW